MALQIPHAGGTDSSSSKRSRMTAPKERRGWKLAPVAAAAVASALVLSSSLGAQTPIFRSGTRVVSLFATVTDAQKRLVPDLTQEDFEVYDNEKLQALVLFENRIQPISVVVMLDTSLSMTGSIKLLQLAAEQFV